MAEVVVRLAGEDITADILWSTAKFTAQSNGAPGPFSFDIRDREEMPAGGRVTVDINGERSWAGYATQVNRTYFFPAQNIAQTTRRVIRVAGADINLLFMKRFCFYGPNPYRAYSPLWPAYTADITALNVLLDDWLDLSGDNLDVTTYVENVADLNADQEGRAWSPGWSWGAAMASIASLPGAVFYIDPERNLVYTDVNTPDAPFGLSDQPNGTTTRGYREMSIIKDGTKLITDILVWGFGYGSNLPVFSRQQANLALHGRWQEARMAYGVYKQATADRIGQSILYGSPTSKRGRKDDKVAVELITDVPGLHVGHKVDFYSEVFDFHDVIPIRQLELTFTTPSTPRWHLLLSHEIDIEFGFIDPYNPATHRPKDDDDDPDDDDNGGPGDETVIDGLPGFPMHLAPTGDISDWEGIPWYAALSTPVRGDEAGPRVWWIRGSASPTMIWEPYEIKVNPEDTYTGIRFLYPQTIAIRGSLSTATVTAGDTFTRVEFVLAHGGDVDDEDVVATVDSAVSSGGLRFYGDTVNFSVDDIDVEAGDTMRINVGIQGLVLIGFPSGRIGFFQPGNVYMYRAGWQDTPTEGETEQQFKGDGSTTEFELSQTPRGAVKVSINGLTQSDYSFDYATNKVIFNFAPAAGDSIMVEFIVMGP